MTDTRAACKHCGFNHHDWEAVLVPTQPPRIPILLQFKFPLRVFFPGCSPVSKPGRISCEGGSEFTVLLSKPPVAGPQPQNLHPP